MCVLDHGMEEKNMALKSSREETGDSLDRLVKLELLANWLPQQLRSASPS